MQEQVTGKAVAVIIKGGKLSGRILKAALRKALQEMEKAQHSPKVYKGKQTIKQLVGQGAGVSNIAAGQRRCRS